MNECKVYQVRESMECQCIAEDSKTRVYLSALRIPDEETLRKKLNARQRARTKKKVTKLMRKGVKKLATVSFGILAGLVTYMDLSARMRVVRGYAAVGGELLFAIVVAFAAYYFSEILLKKE